MECHFFATVLAIMSARTLLITGHTQIFLIHHYTISISEVPNFIIKFLPHVFLILSHVTR